MAVDNLRILNRFDSGMARFLAIALDKADQDAFRHSIATAELCYLYAKRCSSDGLGKDDLWLVGFLHDVGKLGVAKDILEKRGAITTKERKLIESHPSYGGVLIERLFQAPHLGRGIFHHHERFDGTGYPKGLAGDSIPFMSRLISVASTYDAMRSAGWLLSKKSHQAAIAELTNQAGRQFDPDVVAGFTKIEADVFIIHKDARSLSLQDVLARL